MIDNTLCLSNEPQSDGRLLLALRGMMLDALRTGIRYGRCKLYDRILLSQMESAEMIEGRWEIRSGHDDIMMAAMIGWIIGEQWHTGGLGAASIRLNLDNEAVMPADRKQDNLDYITKADPDVQGQALRHFLKVQQYIRRGGPPIDRLQGV